MKSRRLSQGLQSQHSRWVPVLVLAASLRLSSLIVFPEKWQKIAQVFQPLNPPGKPRNSTSFQDLAGPALVTMAIWRVSHKWEIYSLSFFLSL